MNKWDSISWWAAGIFVFSIVAAVITKQDLFLLPMVASYMLRPTLYSLGFASRFADERQIEIQYRSGNIALTIVIGAIIAFIIKNAMEGKPTDEFNTILIIALAARALSGVLLIKNYLEAAVRIAVGIGAMWLLFVTAENGISLEMLMEGLPGFVFIILGLLGKKKPKIVAVIFAVLAIAALFLISFTVKRGFTFYQVITALVVSLPLASTAYCFYKGTNNETKN